MVSPYGMLTAKVNTKNFKLTHYRPAWGGWAFVQLVLFVLIGLRVFGSPVK